MGGAFNFGFLQVTGKLNSKRKHVLTCVFAEMMQITYLKMYFRLS